MREAVAKLWPEIQWIEDKKLREPGHPDLGQGAGAQPAEARRPEPHSVHAAGAQLSHHFHGAQALRGAHRAQERRGHAANSWGARLPVDVDTVIAGAILADVGKLLEYELGADGKSRQSERGEALRHPFTGVALALECGVPDAVCHIIAAHAAEGDLVKRTTEAYIVHHADFMAYLAVQESEEHQS